MTNTNETLASLLQGKLAFKVFNPDTQTWELVSLNSPDLATHAGAKASVLQEGHVQLTNSLESDSETLAPTAKALATVFSAVNSHVNEEGTHLTTEQQEQLQMFKFMQDSYNDILSRLGNIERILLESDEMVVNSLKSKYSVETPTE